MLINLMKVAAAISAFICFAAAEQNHKVNSNVEEINDDNLKNHPRRPLLPTGYYYSLIIAGVFQVFIFVVLFFQDR